MKKIIIAVISFSTILMIFSLVLYSSTFCSSGNRLDRVNSYVPHPSSPAGEEEESDISTADSVYKNVYTPNSLLSSMDFFNFPFGNTTFAKEPDKVVYITIDDGPDPISTPKYLNVLRENHVKATFFMTGAKMEKHPDIVREIASEGHAIGNHSYTHNYGSLYKDTESLTAEITKTEDTIYSITGKRPKIFRAPGGSQNLFSRQGFADKVTELGYAFYDWNVSAADTDPNGITRKQVIDNIERESRAQKKVISLMHDNPYRSASVEALPELIAWFKENGYQFGTLNQSIEPIHLGEHKSSTQKKDSKIKSPVSQHLVQ